MFQTIGLDGWIISANKFMIDDVSFLPEGVTRKMDINAHLPFLYMGYDDWLKYTEVLKKNYQDIVCNQGQNVCYFT